MSFIRAYKRTPPSMAQQQTQMSRSNDSETALKLIRHKDGSFSMLDAAGCMQDVPSMFVSEGLEKMMLGGQPSSTMKDSRKRQRTTASTQAPVIGSTFAYASQQPHYVDLSDAHHPVACEMMHSTSQSNSITTTKIEDDSEDEKPAKSAVSRSFKIEETDKVEEFLISRLSKMQQTAVKRLAKAWIKGICPKKQAKFPYHEAAVVPGWWPNIEDCPFREPDHIKKEKRLNLCLHLLRLRPRPGQLQMWNADPDMHHEHHDFSEWTKFLQETATVDVLKDFKESPGTMERRAKYLRDLYYVAQLEEDYLNGAIDGTDTFTWVEDPADRMAELRRQSKRRDETTPRPSKRHRSDIDAQSSADTLQTEQQSPMSTRSKVESGDERPRKRKATGVRQQSETNSSARQSARQSAATRHSMDCCAMSNYQSNATPAPMSSFTEPWPQPRGPPSTHSSRDEMLTTSFSHSDASFCAPSTTDSYMADSHSMLPMSMAMQGYNNDNQSMIIPTHMVTHLPGPHIETVPNSPIMPHPSLLGLSIDHAAAITASTQPHPWAMEGLTPTQPYSYSASPYDGMLVQHHLTSTPMMRSGSDGFPYVDMRHRGSANLARSPVVRSDSRNTQRHPGQASYGYERYSRPI